MGYLLNSVHHSQFASSNGDGTGDYNLIGDYSTPANFDVVPASGKIFVVTRVMITVEDSGTFNGEGYGVLAALTNGVVVTLRDASGVVATLTPDPVKRNLDWGTLCYDISFTDGFASNQALLARWTFAKEKRSGLILDQRKGLFIRVALSDDLQGLINHKFLFKGEMGVPK